MEEVRRLLVALIPEYKDPSKATTRGNGHIIVDSLHVKAYIRITSRYRNSKLVQTVDIGSVGVDEGHMRKGCCTAFLQCVESIATEWNRHVFVENVHNDILRGILIKRGYTVGNEVDDISYWKDPCVSDVGCAVAK
jgi:hypothetical protein